MPNKSNVVVLFSGGRDSTIAALRLAEEGHKLSLVTIQSNHLFGLGKVEDRIAEIWPNLTPGSRWITADQPHEYTSIGLSINTCLPCQRDYALSAIIFANTSGESNVAFGYARYQADWPEQSPDAILRLRKIMVDNDLALLLPVYDIASKEEARAELQKRGISDESLEQKCLKQITNVKLSPKDLQQQLAKWEISLRSRLSEPPTIDFKIKKTK